MSKAAPKVRTIPPLLMAGLFLVGLALVSAFLAVQAWVISALVNDARDGMTFWEGFAAFSWFFITVRLATIRDS